MHTPPFRAHRFDGQHLGRPPCRQRAAHQAQAQRHADSLHKPLRRKAAGQDSAHSRHILHRAHGQHAQPRANHPPDQAQAQRLAQHHRQHLPGPPADGAQHAKFARPLKDAHQHRVHHPHAADQDRDQRHGPGKHVYVLQRVLFLLKVGRRGRRQRIARARKALLDARLQASDVRPLAHLEQKGIDLARLAIDRLRVLQQDHRRPILKGLPRLIDAHDAIDALVQAKGVPYALVQVVGRRLAQQQRLAAAPTRSP